MADEASEPAEGGRRRPSTLGGAIYLAVLALAIAGLVVAANGHWVTGVRMLAGGLAVAAVARAVVPVHEAGMLAVRSRVFDTGLLAVVAVALWALTASLAG